MFHDCLKNHALHYLRGEKKSRKFLLAPQHLNSFFSHSLESQNNFWQQVGVLCDKGCVRLLRWVLASLNQQVIQSCEFLLPTSDRPNSASTSSQLNDIVLVLFSRGSVYKGFAGTWHGGCWVTVCPMLYSRADPWPPVMDVNTQALSKWPVRYACLGLYIIACSSET